jgi:hypothetical protein
MTYFAMRVSANLIEEEEKVSWKNSNL